jgi:hypothetical protein
METRQRGAVFCTIQEDAKPAGAKAQPAASTCLQLKFLTASADYSHNTLEQVKKLLIFPLF